MSSVNGPSAVDANVADTDLAPAIGTVHTPTPVHAPSQPVKVDPKPGVAVSVAVEAGANGALHVVPQSIPAGLLVTVPLPLPCLETVSIAPATSSAAATSSVPWPHNAFGAPLVPQTAVASGTGCAAAISALTVAA